MVSVDAKGLTIITAPLLVEYETYSPFNWYRISLTSNLQKQFVKRFKRNEKQLSSISQQLNFQKRMTLSDKNKIQKIYTATTNNLWSGYLYWGFGFHWALLLLFTETISCK